MTKQDYFEQLLDSYGSSKVLNDVLTAIADKEITNQKDIDSLLKEREETYTKYANGDLDSYAKSMGYKSKDEYIKEALLPDVKQELLRNKYIKENLDHLLSEYQVVRFKKIIVSKESTALAIISLSLIHIFLKQQFLQLQHEVNLLNKMVLYILPHNEYLLLHQQ